MKYIIFDKISNKAITKPDTFGETYRLYKYLDNPKRYEVRNEKNEKVEFEEKV